jgi:hypothetical protein
MEKSKQKESFTVPASWKSMIGATIENLRYLTPEECETVGFYNSPLMIQLSNGYYLIPIRDDEGNDAGAMWYDHPDGEDNTIYTQRV